MIHYHGGPITPTSVAIPVWTRRHGFVSFEHPQQIALAADRCQSFAIDNGAFSAWTHGRPLDVEGYAAWVNEWRRHPGFDFAIIPDVIDGDEHANDMMFARWKQAGGDLLRDVPVWHMHEPIERLARLCRTWPRVALGSSGAFAEVGSPQWWQRMGAALDHICDDDGRPPCKLHGLRMLNPEIFKWLPLASADSTNVAQNHNATRKRYSLSAGMGALVIADRIEEQQGAARWSRRFGVQTEFFG